MIEKIRIGTQDEGPAVMRNESIEGGSEIASELAFNENRDFPRAAAAT